MDDEMIDGIGPQGGSEDLDELLGAYALDALDADERRRVEDYLTDNPRAAAEVQAHREVAATLAFSGMDAPAGVWDRIAGEIDESGVAAPPPRGELATVMAIDAPPRRRRPARRRLASAAPWIMSAAAVVIVALVAIGLANRAEAPIDPLASAIEVADADRDSITTTLVSDSSDAVARAVIDRNGHGYIEANELPTLAEGRTYQLWGVVSNGDVISLGIFGPDPNLETFTVDGAVTALAITIEEYPGVISDGNPDGAFVGTF